ncbi:PPC domain-containing DNA-binding protein [Glaciimonas sp. PAMC28666]|uniref:PCC domain-containing protein n=1 Tax=Glaciimonas sp. PAMC28666 TaxID=2807626 RepID=UPI0019641A46|nr:PPC domain-containing DNA-binding protein [Glaciimonas sp. PAMC28666]QRX80838.1 DNA-binding protein [Glaciimonas sp. PAMC28666]
MLTIPRSLKQPGKPDPVRIESLDGQGLFLTFLLQPNLSLRDALIAPLKNAGFESGTVRIENLKLRALHYVRPALAKDDQHAAFYSEPHQIEDGVNIKLACATIGRKDGMPFVHCHALWDDSDGMEHGGHLFTDQVIVDTAVQAQAWGLANVAMQADFDQETNFTLFHPIPAAADFPGDAPTTSKRCAIARIRPNEDLVRSIESVCHTHGFKSANIRGSVGSLVGAQFEDGSGVEDNATEILILSGQVLAGASGPETTLHIAVIDPHGHVHRGWIKRDTNPVLICFELVLEEMD